MTITILRAAGAARNRGHGVSSSFSQRAGNSGAMMAFLAQELELGPPELAAN